MACSFPAPPTCRSRPSGHGHAARGPALAGFPGFHAAAVPRPEEGVQDREGPGVPVPVVGHRRLGGGDHQHAVARRQGADRGVRPVLASVGRSVPAARADRRCRSTSNGARAFRSISARRVCTADKSHEIKAVLVCHNETATGVTSDVAGVRKALDAARHPALLMVDGVSSIASIDFRMDEWGVDLAVSGSQKGFMLPTGLAIVAVSQKALAAHKTAKCPRCFFDFADMIRTNKDGYLSLHAGHHAAARPARVGRHAARRGARERLRAASSPGAKARASASPPGA